MTFDIIATILLLAAVAIVVVYLIRKHKYSLAKYHLFEYFIQDDLSVANDVILPLLHKKSLETEYTTASGDYAIFKDIVSEKCANAVIDYLIKNRDLYEKYVNLDVLEFSIAKDICDTLFANNKLNIETKLKDVFYGNIQDTIKAGMQDVMEYDEYFDQFADEENNRNEPSDDKNDDEGVEGCHPEEVSDENEKEEIDRPTTVEELFEKFSDTVEDIDDEK